jgi:hypothetical protein
MSSLWRILSDLTYPFASYTTGHEFSKSAVFSGVISLSLIFEHGLMTQIVVFVSHPGIQGFFSFVLTPYASYTR